MSSGEPLGPAHIETLVSGLNRPECIAWDPQGFLVAGGTDGELYRVDIHTGEVRRLSVDAGSVLGIAIDGRAAIYWCDTLARQVRRFDVESETGSVYSAGASDHGLHWPNSLVFDSDGRLYISDSGSWGEDDGCVYCVDTDGTTRSVTSEPIAFANGLAINPQGDYLYVAESSRPGVSRFPMLGGAGLGPKESVAALPRTVPDGLAFTSDGDLIISCYRPDVILKWSEGEHSLIVDDWAALKLAAPTNIAFYGDELDRLAIANFAGSTIAAVDIGAAGASLRYPDLPPRAILAPPTL